MTVPHVLRGATNKTIVNRLVIKQPIVFFGELSNQPQINTISGNYEILKVLGQGCYGQVVKCFKRDTKETVAVKVSMLDKLRCLDPDKSNIVRCHEWFHRTDHTFMDMSLHEHMYQKKTVPFAFKWHENPHQRSLNAMKGVGLIHTDLKPDNIMLVNHQKRPFRVKLIDLTIETFEAWPGRGVQPLWHR
ncbi:hypothetical protein FQN60_001739 [Etheostoma spectabile]|uniref:Protein kinase domain-containing protein n=1 Tax=Etheostoma spectabile TaxID=54343 RepID=A0A5J5DCW0_9PERO|nr:hypothetical protein FQN60_001739 [Etheostoma spectabile]